MWLVYANWVRYLVLAGPATAELEIKRSRFVCTLIRTDNEEEARAHVAEQRRCHRDARHHCSAFVLGPTHAITRSSDDGEPAGTAGMPMLETLLHAHNGNLSDVCAVVTRWFGGIKLGTGGLTRAYADTVSAALATADIRTREQQALFDLVVPLTDAGRLETALRSAGVTVTTTYADTATLRLGVPALADAIAALHARVTALTAGAAQLAPAGAEWVDH